MTKILDEMPPNYKNDLIAIVSGYEGTSGYNKKDNRFYPVQEKADTRGNLTIGIGHLLTTTDKLSGRFKAGLTREQVDQLFLDDLEVRAKFVKENIDPENWQHFVAILSCYYNCPVAWNSVGNPYKAYKSKDYKYCCERLMLYCMSNNKRQLGLIRRRATEDLYLLTGKVLLGNKDRKQEQQLYKELSNLIVIYPDIKKLWGMK